LKIRTKNILSNTPARVALLFTLFYLTCFGISSFIFYTIMHNRLISQIDQNLLQRHQNLRRVYEDKGIDELLNSVQIIKSDSPSRVGVGYQITDAMGQTLAASFSDFEHQSGFYDVKSETLGFGADGPNYRFYTDTLGDYEITLGTNEQLIDDLQKAFLSSFLLTFLITTTLAFLGAIFLANRWHARVRKIACFMENVGKGDLDSRLPISHRNDDIDTLSGEMNDALTLLQQQVSSMQKVSFNMAHDLKTPLNRMHIKLEEAASLVGADDPVVEKLDAASSDAAQINETFDVLLHIAQIEAGARKANFSKTRLRDLLQKAHEIFEMVAEENEQEFELQLGADELILSGDEDLLFQLIVNLIENAFRHCPPKTTIVLGGGITDGLPWLSVCDNGPGVPSKERARVFERLHRLEESRTTKGAGLGLSLAKAIAEIHGGRITLSDNHPGLCVTVLFDQARTGS